MPHNLLELVESPDPSCWPQREGKLIDFPVQHSHEGWSQGPAFAVQDFTRLTAEVGQMRASFSLAMAGIKQRLSKTKEPRIPSRKAIPTHQGATQRALPLIPAELTAIAEAIENSKKIVGRPPDPSDDLALTCSQETWQRATRILIDHALSIWERIKVPIRAPVISAGPEGSVDLYWMAAPYGLLLNVPADPNQPPTYFGDDAASPESNRTSGNLDPAKPIDIGVLMWLAHTAEQ